MYSSIKRGVQSIRNRKSGVGNSELCDRLIDSEFQEIGDLFLGIRRMRWVRGREDKGVEGSGGRKRLKYFAFGVTCVA